MIRQDGICRMCPEDNDTLTHLEVSALGLEPVVDKTLRISSKTQHELSLGLELVNGLNGFVDLISNKRKGDHLINQLNETVLKQM